MAQPYRIVGKLYSVQDWKACRQFRANGGCNRGIGNSTLALRRIKLLHVGDASITDLINGEGWTLRSKIREVNLHNHTTHQQTVRFDIPNRSLAQFTCLRVYTTFRGAKQKQKARLERIREDVGMSLCYHELVMTDLSVITIVLASDHGGSIGAHIGNVAIPSKSVVLCKTRKHSHASEKS